MDYAMIVAGGQGLRMGGDIPKQFLPIGGRPVLMRTMERFAEYSEDTKYTLEDAVIPADWQFAVSNEPLPGKTAEVTVREQRWPGGPAATRSRYHASSRNALRTTTSQESGRWCRHGWRGRPSTA